MDGRWLRGGHPLGDALTLKTEGTKLTGTIKYTKAGTFPISDGEAHGNAVSFSVTVVEGRLKRTYKGTVLGDELKLIMDGKFEQIFNRVK